MNRWWRIDLWLVVALKIWPMLRKLREDPDSGLLGFEPMYLRGFAFVQYWRSFAHLNRYARNPQLPHHKIWAWFNRTIADSSKLGIWHETYAVPEGAYECVYGNMPLMGLAKAARLVPIAERGQSAARRIRVLVLCLASVHVTEHYRRLARAASLGGAVQPVGQMDGVTGVFLGGVHGFVREAE